MARPFEATGVPPDIEAPIFPKEGLADSRDSAIDKALEVSFDKASGHVTHACRKLTLNHD